MPDNRTMRKTFSKEIRTILNYAREEAVRLGSYSIKTDHLMLGILRLRECGAVAMLEELGADVALLKSDIETLVAAPLPVPFDKMDEVTVSDRVREILSSVIFSLAREDEQPSSIHVLMAIMTDTGGVSAGILEDGGITPASLEDALGRRAENGNANGSPQSPHGDGILSQCGYDLVNAARSGKLAPVIGRDEEIDRLEQILCRHKKNNPLITGEPGSGKSALVEGLAIRIASSQCCRKLAGKSIIQIDLGGLVAGTRFRGQFEERIQSLVREVKGRDDIILFIDEIHTLVGAGGAPGSLDASNLLKPALARGEIQCIGATTFGEYREVFSRDAALERRFQKLSVHPATFAQTLSILEGLRPRYEEFHGVSYSDEALRSCIRLSDRYISERCQPDKAIDLMDEAGAIAQMGAAAEAAIPEEVILELEDIRRRKREAVRKGDFRSAADLRREELAMASPAPERKTPSQEPQVVDPAKIAEAVSSVTGIPAGRVARDEGERLMKIEESLSGLVIGQEKAVSDIARAIRRNRSGLRNPDRPVGAFLFLGPTGVGKTHLSKTLAEYLFGSHTALVRIDMSEYGEKHTVSRLIGAPPGYVGYNDGGQLSEAVRKHPWSVVLLDEIEKAHPDIFNILLQALDEGRLTDSAGRFTDLRNTIIIMTSNVGSREIKDFGDGIGFSRGSGKEREKRGRRLADKALERVFPPEFLNRLDACIYFNSLTKNDIGKIVEIEINSIFKRIETLGFNGKVTAAARKLVAASGYDPAYGARPLKRALQRLVEDPLAEAVLMSPPQGSTLVVDTDDEGAATLVKVSPPKK